jgi:hypothetical protein
MASDWEVTTEATRFALDAGASVDVIFTVTNRSSVNDHAVLDIEAEAPADRSWFTVEEPQRQINPSASMPYKVKIMIPPGTAASTVSFRGLVYSASQAPDETSRYTNRVALEVKPPATTKEKPKWWIPIAIGAAVIVIVLGVVGFLVFKPDSDSGTAEPPPATGPDVTNVQRESTRSDVVAPGTNLSAIAACPTGTEVLGGGHSLRSEQGITVDSSRPAASGQGWQVRGANRTTGNFDFDVDVVCGDVKDRQVVFASVSVPPLSLTTSVVANCPAGKVSIGGGATALNIIIGASRPAASGQGWEARAVNLTSANASLTAAAVCATATSREVVEAATTVPAGAQRDGGVECPAGKVATGGGFDVAQFATGFSLFFSTPSDKGWDVRADNNSGTPSTFTAFAVCLTAA